MMLRNLALQLQIRPLHRKRTPEHGLRSRARPAGRLTRWPETVLAERISGPSTRREVSGREDVLARHAPPQFCCNPAQYETERDEIARSRVFCFGETSPVREVRERLRHPQLRC